MNPAPLPVTDAQALHDCGIHNLPERIELLQRVCDQRSPVSITLQVPGRPVLQGILLSPQTADEQTGMALGIELATPLAAHHALALPAECIAVTHVQGIRVQFQSTLHIDVRSDRLVRASLPSVVSYFQRRETYRVKPTASVPARLMLRSDHRSGGGCTPKVLDVSVGGLSFCWPSSQGPAPQVGARYPQSRLELAGQMPLSCTLEITVVERLHAFAEPEAIFKVGCCLVDPKPAALRALQVYVHAAQVRSLAQRRRFRPTCS